MQAPAQAPAPAGARRAPVEPPSTLPPELERFLRVLASPSILIRGPAGGGKTALALRLLSRAAAPTIWITTRAAGARNTPRLLTTPGLRTGQLRWIDLSVGGSDSDGLVPAVAAARRALLERGHSADRDDSAYWLPPVLRGAWAELGNDPQLSVAIDSWEGLVDLYLDCEPDPAVPEGVVERLLIGHLIRRGLRLVLVCERNVESSLDYEVDAVLQIAHGELEERGVRVLTMPKLRGVTREEAVYPFTLEEGSFTYLPRTERIGEYVRFRAQPDPRPEAGGVWPGSRDFAEAFGRLAVGGFSLLEREDSVPSEIPRRVATTMVLSTLKAGGRALVVLPPGLSPESVYERFRARVPTERLEKSLRFLGVPVAGQFPTAVRPVMISLEETRSDVAFVPVSDEAERPTAPLFPDAVEFLLGSINDPVPALALLDLAGLAHATAIVGRALSPELLIATLRESSRGNPVHGIVTGVVGEPLLDLLRPLAQPYVRWLTRRGRIFALGYLPWTAAFAVLPPTEADGEAPYRLLRMN